MKCAWPGWQLRKMVSRPSMKRRRIRWSMIWSVFYGHLEQTLLATGFIRENHPGQVMNKLRRLFTRARPESRGIEYPARDSGFY